MFVHNDCSKIFCERTNIEETIRIAVMIENQKKWMPLQNNFTPYTVFGFVNYLAGTHTRI